MSEEEPAGLNMSLDDIIKTSAEVRVKSGRVAEYDHSGRGGGHSGRGDTGEFKGIHCFDCMRAGFPTVFSSKQELVAHKAIGIHLGQGQQKGIHCFDCKSKVSAFTRRSWSTIRTQLKQLPESIPVVDPTAPQNKRQATS
eukprot:gene49927-66876_t